jgi:hypothetical protein
MVDHLPNDPSQWPNDPFALLGVMQPVSEADLRRAYTRLIRRYKPEHHPEEFRRIREAYEIALRQIEWFRFIPAPEPPEAEPAASTAAVETRPLGESVESPPAEPETPPGPATVDPVDEAWSLAIAGQRAEAYSRLIEFDRSRPESPDSSLRLYWLLAIDPGLDSARSRHDWLAGTLVRSRLQGPAVELYRRELAVRTEEALFGPYVDLLAARDAPPQAVLGVARERLVASGAGGWWARLEGDLRTLSHRSSEFDDSAWLWYLVEAMGYVAFDDQENIFERCHDLLRDLRHLELSHAWAFDRVDELRAMAAVWKRTSCVATPVRELLRGCWTGCTRLRRDSLELAAAWVAEDLARSLRVLDQMARSATLGPMLGTLVRIFEEVPVATGGLSPDIIRGLAAAFLKHGIRKDYAAMRPELIQLLVEERIDPRELVLACSVDVQYRTRSLADAVREDGVLWLVWQLATAEPAA